MPQHRDPTRRRTPGSSSRPTRPWTSTRTRRTPASSSRNYPEDYFSHIVIDECHRSAWGKWSAVLTRNPNAVQIGLTATPRTLDYGRNADAAADAAICADNLRHFGEPVYEYDIGQGIEDGYLAACEIVRRDIFIGDSPFASATPASSRTTCGARRSPTLEPASSWA